MSGGAAAQLGKKQGDFVVATQREVYESLARDKNFLIFMGWLLERCGFTSVTYENSGSEVFKFEGRRQIALETLQEIEKHSPEVYERVMRERRNFKTDFDRISLTPEERAKAEENDDG